MKLTPLCIRLIARIAVAICERKAQAVAQLRDFPCELLLLCIPCGIFSVFVGCIRSHNALVSTTTRLVSIFVFPWSSNWNLIHRRVPASRMILSAFTIFLRTCNRDSSVFCFILYIIMSHLRLKINIYPPSKFWSLILILISKIITITIVTIVSLIVYW